mmetsp:Transcript_67359/g.133484  ORF Transcript_67359/g.133484 Transcript_67359/m.133484 type:complete len:203 (+) Transcript_67359:1045-1653(+)
MSRPGVATRTCTPASISVSCFSRGAPPYTHAAAMPNGLPKRLHSASIWHASSRVGARTSVVSCGSTRPEASAAMRESAGARKAKVFPEPVRAMPITSRPLIATAHAVAWMGDGTLKPAPRMISISAAGKPVVSNVKKGAGQLSESFTSCSVSHAATVALLGAAVGMEATADLVGPALALDAAVEAGASVRCAGPNAAGLATA